MVVDKGKGEDPMYFNRFDICEAYLMYLINYHMGGATRRCEVQNRSIEYQLHNMNYNPSVLLTESSLSDNAREIYHELIHRWEGIDNQAQAV
jgi:hypothetical protein